MRALWSLTLLAACGGTPPPPPAVVPAGSAASPSSYRWLASDDRFERLESRFPPPRGFHRRGVARGSFAEWLRGLPLRPAGSPVRLFDGREKRRQDVHAAVIALDVGRRDLQQCADSALRLRAEYLLLARREEDLAFRFTSGHLFSWPRWRDGERPVVRGNSVAFRRSARPDGSRASFRAWLDTLFAYAGTASLEKELAPAEGVEAGDLFIEGGFPGHAVIVVDVAREARSGRTAFLLAQGYTPAQEMHVLKNPRGPDAWYLADFGATLVTPEWRFTARQHRRWADR